MHRMCVKVKLPCPTWVFLCVLLLIGLHVTFKFIFDQYMPSNLKDACMN